VTVRPPRGFEFHRKELNAFEIPAPKISNERILHHLQFRHIESDSETFCEVEHHERVAIDEVIASAINGEVSLMQIP
jgi:hypothetical protein